MTLEQAKKLKEMGFPQDGLTYTYYTWEGYRLFPSCVGIRPTTDKENFNYSGEWYDNPTAEEALEWVAGKLNQIITIRILIKHVMISCYVKDGKYHEFISECSLSDAVYALIVWAYENKLLEGK